MTLSALDWVILGAYFAVSAAIGLALAKRGASSLTQYFLSGRALPWWLAGTSMVATTFAADTPLAVTGLVAKYGVAGNWLWWNGALSGLLTVFFFSRLWRRSEVLTDVELTELRYAGRPAAALRAFRALYLALPINLIIMGWVTRAMVTILDVALGIDGWRAVLLLFGITAGYSILSGLWGVIVTDFFQFVVAMTGSVALAVFAIAAAGGVGPLVAATAAHYGDVDRALASFPPLAGGFLPLSTIFVFVAVQWWASWYPGAEPGGGGYVAQRILSAKDERHGLLATLWFNIAHYALRPWPWIIVALFAVGRYPGLANPEAGYVHAMVDLLPGGWRGLMLAAFAAAYMSTISTHLNWGASYLVNDVYLRFLARGGSAGSHGAPARGPVGESAGPGTTAGRAGAVLIGRLATVALMGLALVVMRLLGSVEAGWKLLLAVGSGTGLVLILRWYWWRVNAWSEIAAMVASFATAMLLLVVFGRDPTDPTGGDYAYVILVTTGVTTAVWLAVTFLTPPESEATLEAFYLKVRPGGPGWRRVAAPLGLPPEPAGGGKRNWLNWVASWAAVYAAVFGIGKLILGPRVEGALWLGASAAAFVLVARGLRRAAPAGGSA
ncbi:MAG: Na+:solute symporter [Gemmatimonadetes bacterium]|nr:Na+:solute symporter [Gemmatimonadota bacterium]